MTIEDRVRVLSGPGVYETRLLEIAKKYKVALQANAMTLLRPRDLAESLHVSVGQVYRLVAQRRVPFVKLGGAVRFRPERLERQIKDINGRRGRVASRIPSCALAPLVHHRRGDPGEKKSTG